jgi:hypothetical protein
MDRIKEGVESESKMKIIIDLIAKKCFPTLCKETRWSELCSDFAFKKKHVLPGMVPTNRDLENLSQPLQRGP